MMKQSVTVDSCVSLEIRSQRQLKTRIAFDISVASFLVTRSAVQACPISSSKNGMELIFRHFDWVPKGFGLIVLQCNAVLCAFGSKK
jgi:hypothetical protein